MSDNEILLKILQSVEQLNGKVDKLEANQAEMLVRLDKLEAKVDKLEAKVDSLEVKVDKLEAKVDKLEAKVDKLEAIVERNFKETAAEVGKIVEVIGKKIEDTDRALSAQVNDLVTITAQNSFDVQLVRGRAR